MTRHTLSVLMLPLIGLVVACGVDEDFCDDSDDSSECLEIGTQQSPLYPTASMGYPSIGGVRQAGPLTHRDLDGDDVDDGWEDFLARTWAPEVRLAPSSKDWTRPANVDWYLSRVRMRFDHAGCKDCQILDKGSVTQRNIYRQHHRNKKGFWCSHSGSNLYSNDLHKEFFIQPADSAHAGSEASAWKTYVHVRFYKDGAPVWWWPIVPPNSYVVQYWFFYPYNDGHGGINHEGDWEHISVVLDTMGQFRYAYYSQHEGGSYYSKSQLAFVGRTHPVVYSADGSHANYRKIGSYLLRNAAGTWLGLEDKTYGGGPRWQTWRNFVNVGEMNRPLNGQTFIKYGGRWGEVGTWQCTSGPLGPAFQSSWNLL